MCYEIIFEKSQNILSVDYKRFKHGSEKFGFGVISLQPLTMTRLNDQRE